MRASRPPSPVIALRREPFSVLPLEPMWLDALAQSGHVSMTPLQAAALPLALAGHDLIVQARQGGRATTLAIALLHRLDPQRFDVQALVLCPTRDRADMVARRIRQLARVAGQVKVALLCTGMPIRAQIDSLIHGAHIVVGTPGRMLDHIDAASLDLRAVNTVIFEAADTMLDMGFADDIAFVASRCPKSRQTLLFHASPDADPPPEIVRLARQWQRKPRAVRLGMGEQPSV
ncbi:ATP-dependent 23S rRNA helicase DbpA [Cupriavidus sp. U2]|uniref:DEAD/DEAH box helicase n=1 Tax=Cupriavidus sp. U2 TaxID=2920269 RepID=UPI00129E6E1E|nr:DEAD/DEAH box helicase [Cupriavidus sp. U2]KAI3594370.1 ATP-dependent 23S rRNA helicase DbpA [Cupriavidus sp. U2]